MNHKSFVSVLAVQFLLLLILSGFCLWIAGGLTTELSSSLDQYERSNSALNDLRSILSRINEQSPVFDEAGGIPAAQNSFPPGWDMAERELKQVQRNASSPAQRKLIAQLTALCKSHLAASNELFAAPPPNAARRAELGKRIAGLTADVSNVADRLTALNANLITGRRDAAIFRAHRLMMIAIGCMIISLALQIVISTQLARSVFRPLRRLHDSIQLLSARRFDTVVPIEGGEELRQVARSFNNMVAAIRRYEVESQERAFAADRVNRAFLGALPYPLYVVDQDLVLRQTNRCAEELNSRQGVSGALPDAIRELLDANPSPNRETIGDDIRHVVHLATGQAKGDDFLPQIFRLAGAFGANDGWGILLVKVTRLRRNIGANAKALTMLSHEVRTPLAGIRLSLHLLLEEKLGTLNPDQRELLEVGREECERMLATLQRLLELARLESGHTELQLVPTNPVDLLAEARATHGDALQHAGSELRIDDVGGRPTVLADPFLVNRVLGNLLSNAGKYGAKGQPVVLSAKPRNDGYVRLSVVNHGEPLNESEQAQVFQPFIRRRGENSPDSNLDLALCYEIAALHGGRMGVHCPAGSDLVEFFFDLRRAE